MNPAVMVSTILKSKHSYEEEMFQICVTANTNERKRVEQLKYYMNLSNE